MASTHLDKRLKARIWVRALLGFLPIVAIILLCAGRLDYWQGWFYLGANVVLAGVTTIALARTPDLLQERVRPGAGMKGWDRWYFALTAPLWLATLAVGCLDAARFGWAPPVAIGLIALGCVAYVLGQLILLWAKLTNPFFSSVVRIQSDRGQTVSQDGPYRFIRHPGYLGGIVFGISTPLVLGSWWAMLPAAVSAALLVVRTLLEDRALLRELTGYSEYAKRVRYRLLPGIW